MLARMPAEATPELELKFQLDADAVNALSDVFPPNDASTSQLHAVYFDTDSHAARDGGFSLRVRRKGDAFIQTLKHRAGGGLFKRDEWEVEVSGFDLDLAYLASTPLLAAIGDMALAPAFVVEVERRLHTWIDDTTEIEVSFDTGHILADGRSEPVAEMELELLSGSAETLFALARVLQAKAALTPAYESKADRGYRLVGHDGFAALKAQYPLIKPETSSADAFQMIARAALVQIAGNASLLRQAHNPDVLHQIRVGLRRLRALLTVFKPMLDQAGLHWARAETRWLASALAPARDLDVILRNADALDEIEDNVGRAAFYRALRLAQAEAYETALASIGSARFRSLLLELGALIEAGAWLTGREQSARSLDPAVSLAIPALQKLDAVVRRKSRRLMSQDAAARHDLRKQVKKLRYATAFFADSFPKHPKRRQRLIENLRALQNQLGALNDMALARRLAKQISGRRSSELAYAAGLEVGRLTADEAEVLNTTCRAVKSYRKRRPFWPLQQKPAKDINLSKAG